MKKLSASLFWILVVACSCAHAQVYKCKNAQGKMEYSDVPCASADSQKVNIVPPSFGGPSTSSGDPNARALKMLEADRLRSGPPPAECKFKSFKNNDSKGKILADNATAECVENMVRKANGQPISLEAYNLWKDHHSIESDKRNAAIARIQADANAQQITQQLNQNANATNRKLDELGNKRYRCNPSGIRNEIECR